MDIIIENKKPIISFVVGLILGALLWALVSPAKTTFPNGIQPLDQARIEAQRQAMANRPLTGQQMLATANRPALSMPWTAVSGMIANAPVEKIEVLSGLLIKLYLKGGPTFTSEQPTKDAYIPLLKKAKNTIQIVK